MVFPQSAVFKRPAENGLAEMGQSDSGQHFESELMVVTMRRLSPMPVVHSPRHRCGRSDLTPGRPDEDMGYHIWSYLGGYTSIG